MRVFAYPAAADLRKGYDGLRGLVASELGLFLEGSRVVGRIELSPSECQHVALASDGRL